LSNKPHLVLPNRGVSDAAHPIDRFLNVPTLPPARLICCGLII
jgi:hypothetical protein